MTEADPRGNKANLNDEAILIRIHNVINPDQAYQSTDLPFRVTHQRYTYANGPVMLVHQTAVDSLYFSDFVEPGTSSTHTCQPVNDYSEHLPRGIFPKDILLFVELTGQLNKPVLQGGHIVADLDGVTSLHELTEGGTTDCYVTSTSLTPAPGKDGVLCKWWSEDGKNTDKVVIYNYAAASNPVVSFRV